MPEVYDMSWQEVWSRTERISQELRTKAIESRHRLLLFGVPNGGLIPAVMISDRNPSYLTMTEHPAEADFYVDDVYDSGKTYSHFCQEYYPSPGVFLVDKRNEMKNMWVSFPWERANKFKPTGAEDAVVRMLQYIGEDSNREGLKETPKRVVKSWAELFAGYKEDPEKMLTVFEEDGSDEMVVLRDIGFNSTCEHHLLPFMGVAHIAYVPDKRVIGVSKLVRLLEIYSKRLQIQERLCQQVTAALNTHLKPLGSACVLQAKHLCMSCRGVKKQDSVMITSSLTGVFKEDLKARSEFLHFIK